MNANASALGLLITLGAFITNLYYQRKLYKLRAAQVEAGKRQRTEKAIKTANTLKQIDSIHKSTEA